MLKTIVLKNTGKNKYTLGSVVNFPRGYARYLIEQGRALYATENNQILSEKLLAEEKKKRAEKIKNAEMIAAKLSKEKISFIASQYNGNGILFGAIKIYDIVNVLHKLSKDYGHIKNVDVSLNNIIKTHGIYILTIFLYEKEVKIPVFVGKSEQNIQEMVQEYNDISKVAKENKEENNEEGKHKQIKEEKKNE